MLKFTLYRKPEFNENIICCHSGLEDRNDKESRLGNLVGLYETGGPT